MYIQPNDFGGKWEIHQGMYSYEKVLGYIDRYTPIYMTQLLGAELYKRYIADNGSSPCFDKINLPFVEELPTYFGDAFGYNNGLLISDGIKNMMKGFLYFEIMKDEFNQATIYGEVRQNGEVSNKTTSLNTLIYNRYNEAVRTYNAIQQYIITHMDDFGGEIVAFDVTDFGTNYTASPNVEVMNLSGSMSGVGAIADILNVDSGSGAVLLFELTNKGRNYSVDDEFYLSGGDDNCVAKISYVGDNFDGFHGVKKTTAYWL